MLHSSHVYIDTAEVREFWGDANVDIRYVSLYFNSSVVTVTVRNRFTTVSINTELRIFYFYRLESVISLPYVLDLMQLRY
jgi:hypothetical protein